MNFLVNKFSIYHARDYYVICFCTVNDVAVAYVKFLNSRRSEIWQFFFSFVLKKQL